MTHPETSATDWAEPQGIIRAGGYVRVQPRADRVVFSAADESCAEPTLPAPAAVAFEAAALLRTATRDLRAGAVDGWDKTIQVPGQGSVYVGYETSEDYGPTPLVFFGVYTDEAGEALQPLNASDLDTFADLVTAAATAAASSAPAPTAPAAAVLEENPECAGCHITAADLPDEIGPAALLAFELGDDGRIYCQGCREMHPSERLAAW